MQNQSSSLVPKLFVIIAFALTLISLLIAGFLVPSFESSRQENDNDISQLQEVYSQEFQRYGQHSLNLSSAAQIIASERILAAARGGGHPFTRDALLGQGRQSVIRGLKERRRAIDACRSAVESLHVKPVITGGELPPVPETSAAELFNRFDESSSRVIQTMRGHVQKIQEVDDAYEMAWKGLSRQIGETLNRLGSENSVLNYKISFYMRLSLGLQVLALLVVFVKDFLGN